MNQGKGLGVEGPRGWRDSPLSSGNENIIVDVLVSFKGAVHGAGRQMIYFTRGARERESRKNARQGVFY